MSRFYSNKFIASLAITALTLTGGLSPVVAMASDVQIKSTYNVQSTQSLVNALTRLGGYDRYGTTVQIADYGWQSASTAVLAPSGDLNMVDALASSSLANAVDGPILLADKDSVPSDTMSELKKLGVKKVYMVSGTAVISAKVESDLSAAGIQTVRLGGYDRYETAVNIAKEIQTIKPFQEIVVTNAFANVDAISIAPIAAAKGIPVLLVDKDSVPTAVSDFINLSGINKTYVIGGTAVVADSVKDALPNALRLGGNDRFDTNTEVLKEFKNLIAGGKMFFANGNDSSLIDSLAGAPMVAKVRGAIVLVNKESVPDGTKGFIQKNIALKNPGILGGTAVISDSTVQSLGYNQPGQLNNLDGALELNTLNATFEDKTVNGNILVNADGVTLKNVVVKGTIFVDPGKDGSATLDSVQADRIVVLSGAELSIYLKETTSDSLVVSSSSNVRVVAETGTILGSTLVQSNANVESQNGADIGPLAAQSLGETPINVQLQGTFSNEVSLSGSIKLTAADGSIIPSLNVAKATSPDSIQLAGNFPSVSIDDNSSITVLSGKIDKLVALGTSEIDVKSGAEITELSSVTGGIKVSGGGTVDGKTTTDTPTELGDISSTPVIDRDRDRDRDVIQKSEPVISGTVRAGDTTISGTSEAGATISVKKNDTEIGTATADGTGIYTVTLNDGVTLAKDEVLSIIAKAPYKSISNTVNITVAAAQTTQPTVMGTVGAGETMIMGTA
ncbi:cell wall-binding repeat-containing protein, partial [Desulfosporosinus sp.]|uniref:cell wall-binding repeat-containing protein n=1 Tax=Desulfosporosinus sp. TaxID=157907 RepID=UPI0025BC560B